MLIVCKVATTLLLETLCSVCFSTGLQLDTTTKVSAAVVLQFVLKEMQHLLATMDGESEMFQFCSSLQATSQRREGEIMCTTNILERHNPCSLILNGYLLLFASHR